MSYDEALLTLAQYILTGDMENTLSTCDSFPELDQLQKDDFRTKLYELICDESVLKGEDVIQIIDKFDFEKVEPLKAILKIVRNLQDYITSDEIKASEAYQLVSDEGTEYYNEIERSSLIRTLASRAISSRNLELIQFMLSKVKEYGI